MLPKATDNSYKGHIIYEEACRKIKAVFGKYDELLNLVKKRKLRLFGHVLMSSGLATTIGTEYSNRKEKKRQTDEEVGRQY